MATPNNSNQHQEAFCHPEQHQEAHEETLGAAAQQQPMVEAAAAPQPQLSEGEKKALQIHNQGKTNPYHYPCHYDSLRPCILSCRLRTGFCMRHDAVFLLISRSSFTYPRPC